MKFQTFDTAFKNRVNNLLANIKHTQSYSDQRNWQELKRVRNIYLAQSDWTQNSDNTLTPEQREAWKVYRQQLRDLPDNYPDPKTVVWPVKPD